MRQGIANVRSSDTKEVMMVRNPLLAVRESVVAGESAANLLPAELPSEIESGEVNNES